MIDLKFSIPPYPNQSRVARTCMIKLQVLKRGRAKERGPTHLELGGPTLRVTSGRRPIESGRLVCARGAP